METQTTVTKINSQPVRAMLLRALQENKKDLQVHEDIKAILTPLDGKPLTNRTFKNLPAGYSIEFKYGLVHIICETNDNSRHLIAHSGSNDVVNVAIFDDKDACHCIGSINRIAQIENFLKPENLPILGKKYYAMLKTWNAFKAAVKDFDNSKFDSFNNPCYYEMLRSIGIGSHLCQNIKYGEEIK